MSLEDDLLDAIAHAPDDPAARLVYADHRLGISATDPHAELIVVQERLAELEGTGLWRDAFSTEAQSLRAREKTILASLEAALDLPSGLATWRRGFVERLALSVVSPWNLVKRITHPAFRVVRTLHFRDPEVELAPILARVKPTVRRVEGNFGEANLRALDPIDEVRVTIARAATATRPLRRLEQLEITEGELIVPDQLQRELAWGYREARRAVQAAAEDFAAAERNELASSFDKLPATKHLVLETSAPLDPATLLALSKYREPAGLETVRFHASHERAAKALINLGSAFSHVRFLPLRDADREVAARAEVNVGDVCAHAGRIAEAAEHYDDAFCFSEGRYPALTEVFARVSARKLTDPDPARDGLLHRVPALLRWGQIDRVLAVAPRHRGAWALRALRHREDFELADAEAAFVHALEDEPDAPMLAKAYAWMLEDPPAALAVLNEVAPSPHANVLFACIQALESQADLALGLLRDHDDPIARLAVGLLERQCGRGVRGREIWQELGRVPERVFEPARWVVTFFAATLASSEPYQKRRLFHEWLATAEPRAPIAALVFDPLIRVANKVMPQVDLTMVSREVERLRGA